MLAIRLDENSCRVLTTWRERRQDKDMVSRKAIEAYIDDMEETPHFAGL